MNTVIDCVIVSVFSVAGKDEDDDAVIEAVVPPPPPSAFRFKDLSVLTQHVVDEHPSSAAQTSSTGGSGGVNEFVSGLACIECSHVCTDRIQFAAHFAVSTLLLLLLFDHRKRLHTQ